MMKDSSQQLEPGGLNLLEFWAIMIPDLQPNRLAAFSDTGFWQLWRRQVSYQALLHIVNLITSYLCIVDVDRDL